MSEKARLKVFRYDERKKQPAYSIYEVPREKGMTVLQALFWIKDLYEDAPAFRRYQCNRGQCCSCLMTIDGEVKRACTTMMREEMVLEPLQDYPVIRDLIVDFGMIVDGKLVRKGTMIQLSKPVWEVKREIKKFLVFDKEKCTGCEMCQATCPVNRYETVSDKYGVIIRPPILFEKKDGVVEFRRVCAQCTNAPCMHFCPAKVITRDEKTGAIRVEKEHCFGCGFCIAACPNDAIFLDLGRGKAIKCELCGGNPECVANCPSEALRLRSVE